MLTQFQSCLKHDYQLVNSTFILLNLIKLRYNLLLWIELDFMSEVLLSLPNPQSMGLFVKVLHCTVFIVTSWHCDNGIQFLPYISLPLLSHLCWSLAVMLHLASLSQIRQLKWIGSLDNLGLTSIETKCSVNPLLPSRHEGKPLVTSPTLCGQNLINREHKLLMKDSSTWTQSLGIG